MHVKNFFLFFLHRAKALFAKKQTQQYNLKEGISKESISATKQLQQQKHFILSANVQT